MFRLRFEDRDPRGGFGDSRLDKEVLTGEWISADEKKRFPVYLALAGISKQSPGVTGRLYGIDECRTYGPHDIDAEFRHRNRATLAALRGAGYWLWKPYVLARALADLADGDLVLYADAAMHFVNPIDPMVALMEQRDLDLLILGEGITEAPYTKRDAFVLMNADTRTIAGGPQRFANAFMLRNSAWARRFVARFLACAQDDRLLTERVNTCGLPNYPGFVAHRHDQSIFSILSKQQGAEYFPTNAIAAGLPERAHQILNHTRTHISPREIVTRLLIQGVLSLTDLAGFDAACRS